MKIVRTFRGTLRALPAVASVAVPLALAVALAACDDENDPKTWVKRLDDPAQRANSINRLTQFYEDDMTKASNNADAPEVKALLDAIVEPLTRQYTSSDLDDKTRTDLMKFLAETHDARTQPALAKALKDFEMGRTDDEARVSCESIAAMSKAGIKLDTPVVDELWNVFSRFRLSKTTSQRLYQSLHDAVVGVHDPSYGPKATEKLKADVPPPSAQTVDLIKDQVNWWQLTSVQVISELRFTQAIPQLILVLLSPNKIDLNATARIALLKMAPAAEPELVKALHQDPPYDKAADDFKDKANQAIVADVLALLSRPAGRDALLAAIAGADTDTTRYAFAQALVQFPADPRIEPAFLGAYKKLTWTSSIDFLNDLKPRAALEQAASGLYDPNLTDWLLKETAGAPDEPSKLLGIDSALKLMPSSKREAVGSALKQVGLRPEYKQPAEEMFGYAGKAVDKCDQNVQCYLGLLDEPIPSSPKTANWRAMKAAWMSVIYGQSNSDATRAQLVRRVDAVKDAAARLAIVEAIDALAPKGDVAAADALDKIVAADTATGDKNVLMGDDSVVKIALRLRARAAP